MRRSMLRAAACVAVFAVPLEMPAVAEDSPAVAEEKPAADPALEAVDFEQLKALFDEAGIPNETHKLNGDKHPYLAATLHGFPLSAVLTDCADEDASKGCTRLYMQSFTTADPAAADVPEKWNRQWAWATAVTAGPDDRRSWIQHSYDVKGVNKAYIRQNFIYFTNSMANYWDVFKQAAGAKAETTAGFSAGIADLKLGVARQKATGGGTGNTSGGVSAFGP